MQIIAPSINIPDPIIVTMKSSADETTKKTWVSLIDESVYTSDDVDIGDIDAVSRDFIVVKRGFVNIHYYYISISKVEGWDGNVLWLKITEEEVIRKYQKDDIVVPDPSRYYVKDCPIYTTMYYPELTIIPSRYTRPSYKFASTTITATMNTTQLIPDNVSPIYLCDLCNESKFTTEDELSDHVLIQHK